MLLRGRPAASSPFDGGGGRGEEGSSLREIRRGPQSIKMDEAAQEN
jgi:hypothetical protein